MDRTAYDRWLELETKHFWRVERRALILETIERHLPRAGRLRILDVGGASSLVSREMGRFGDVVVVEPDAPSVEIGRAAGLDIREGALPDRLPVEGPFDLITLFDVLEHVDDDAGAVSAVRRLLSPDGRLVVTVPAVPLLWSDHDVSVHHRRRYLEGTLRSALEGGGFSVDYLTYFTSFLFPVIATQRLLSRARGVRREATYDVSVPAAPINGALRAIMHAERVALRKIRLPIGSSLLAVCRPTTG